MSSILDSIENIKKLDSENMSGSIEKLADQVIQIQSEVSTIKLPPAYKKAKNIVFLGMGGSSLGAHCIKSIYENNLQVPFEIVNGYDIPGNVNKSTLVFAVSYSGNTEETVSALEKAKKRGAMIVVITSGGELSKQATRYKLPALVFKTDNNPCGSPRMGLGYTIYGPLLILGKLGFVSFGAGAIKVVVETIKRYQNIFGPTSPESSNLAKSTAVKLLKGNVWLVGAKHLSGSVHVSANQINENAKRFGGYFLIPELNHHLLEGLSFPAEGPGSFLFVQSDLYDAKVKKRFAVTKEILNKRGINYVVYECVEKSALLQAAEFLVFGSYLGFYLAILEGIDPTAIPTVNFLKAALKV